MLPRPLVPLAFLSAAPVPGLSRAQAVAAGERLFPQRCAASHALEEGQTRTTPDLAGVIGHPSGSIEGACHSRGMQEPGIIRDAESPAAFIADPRAMARGTRVAVSVCNPHIIACPATFPASADAAPRPAG